MQFSVGALATTRSTINAAPNLNQRFKMTIAYSWRSKVSSTCSLLVPPILSISSEHSAVARIPAPAETLKNTLRYGDLCGKLPSTIRFQEPAILLVQAYNRFQVKQNNLLPLPPGRTLIFERNHGDSEGIFVCSACRKDFHTSDPAEGMAQFNLHKCEPKRNRADG